MVGTLPILGHTQLVCKWLILFTMRKRSAETNETKRKMPTIEKDTRITSRTQPQKCLRSIFKSLLKMSKQST